VSEHGSGLRAEVETAASGADAGDNSREPIEAGAVDTHCHLFLIEADPAEVIEEARSAGVSTLVCVGIDPESSRRSLELAESFRGVFATAGVHPHTASEFDEAAGAVIEELLGSPQVLAVGETGLDFYRMLSSREDQERAFRVHVALARESGKPLVVHVRDAWPEAMAILDHEGAEGVVLHCFSADVATAREAEARGYLLSFSGTLTYPRNEYLREAAAAVASDSLLVETDSPYLAPQSLRGRDNRPANVVAVLEELSRVRDEALDDVRTATSANAALVFDGLR
jgi:TatD DNase family protein